MKVKNFLNNFHYKSMKNFLTNTIKGIAIGAGAILPGISSGVLCVILGIYEKLLDSILNFFKDIKNNFRFLFPLIIGGAIGVLLFSNILNYLLYAFPIQTKSIFIGLILGTVPSLIKEVNEKERFKKYYIIFLLIALAIGIFTVILENMMPSQNTSNYSFLNFFLAGLFMSVGIIVPGVSSTIILMILGVYSIYLQSISTLYMPVLIPMGLGLIIGCLVCMKITKLLLERHYAPMFYSIIGFTLGSVFVLFPAVSNALEILICILCVILGLMISKAVIIKK